MIKTFVALFCSFYVKLKVVLHFMLTHKFIKQ